MKTRLKKKGRILRGFNEDFVDEPLGEVEPVSNTINRKRESEVGIDVEPIDDIYEKDVEESKGKQGPTEGPITVAQSDLNRKGDEVLKTCPYCGYKNNPNYWYCEKCGRPLDDERGKLEDWMILEYLTKNVIGKIDSLPNIVDSRDNVKLGRTQFNHVVQFEDGSVLLIYIVHKIEKIKEIVDDIIMNKDREQKVKLSFLFPPPTLDKRQPKITEDLVKLKETALEHNVEVEYNEYV